MAKKGIEYLNSPTKRALDVIGAAVGLCVLSPLIVATGIASAIDSRAWPVFRQKRIGQAGQDFTVLKFLTIKPERTAGEVVTHGTYDPRATRLGSFMRRWGLDELPQFINVLRGEMSLVGPRPMLDRDIEKHRAADPELFEKWHAMNRAVKPGIFGDSQIFKRRHAELGPDVLCRAMEMDLAYAERASLAVDVWTPLTMFKPLGVDVGAAPMPLTAVPPTQF